MVGLTFKKGMQVLRELERVLEHEEVVALLRPGIGIEPRIRYDGSHPALTRQVVAVFAREDGCRYVDLVADRVAPFICGVMEQHLGGVLRIG